MYICNTLKQQNNRSVIYLINKLILFIMRLLFDSEQLQKNI